MNIKLFRYHLISFCFIDFNHYQIRKEQSALADTRNPSLLLSNVKSNTESSCPLSSVTFSPDSRLNTLIVASSLATYTYEQLLSKMAQLAAVSPESSYLSSLAILKSQIFVIPSQSAETSLSPYIQQVRVVVNLNLKMPKLIKTQLLELNLNCTYP